MAKLNKKSQGVLAEIVKATLAGGFIFVTEADGKPLLGELLIEVNPTIKDGDKLGAKATAKGIELVSKTPAGNDAASGSTEQAPAASAFEIESDVPLPAVSARGRTGSTYPFDAMQVNQSFFVPKEAKNLASTISSANARYAEVIEGQTRVDRKGKTVPATKLTRKFVVRTAEKGGVKGARIFRVA